MAHARDEAQDEETDARAQDATDARVADRERHPIERLRRNVRELYYGVTPTARRFRFALLAFDVVAISYFVVTTVTGTAAAFQAADVVIGLVLLADLVARVAVSAHPAAFLWRISFWIDVVVLLALFGSAFVEDLDFLRVLRVLRVLRSYRLLVELRRDIPWFRRQEEVVESALNLLVFVFVCTSLVFVVEDADNQNINSFVDALYFTIATLTTTGFGDIIPSGTVGRLLAIAIMVVGVGLFLRLIQAVFRPSKVSYECPTCGLERHDLDAVHCKHCGETINIPTQGAV